MHESLTQAAALIEANWPGPARGDLGSSLRNWLFARRSGEIRAAPNAVRQRNHDTTRFGRSLLALLNKGYKGLVPEKRRVIIN